MADYMYRQRRGTFSSRIVAHSNPVILGGRVAQREFRETVELLYSKRRLVSARSLFIYIHAPD